MTEPRHVKVGGLTLGNDLPLVLIAGPCVMEGREHALEMASALAEMAEKLDLGLIYKTSFDKANRTSHESPRGLGLEEALAVFAEIRDKVGCPVLTDVHLPGQCETVAQAVDALQIPAFLCRQTDLLEAAARTGRPINVKKGQFMAPWDMKNVVEKVAGSSEGNNARLLLTERGTSFGYNRLISDMTAIPTMREFGYPVIFDATHSVQQPGGLGASSGGNREMIPTLARAAVAAGCDGLFLEVHPEPDQALSDGPNILPLEAVESLLKELLAIRAALAQG